MPEASSLKTAVRLGHFVSREGGDWYYSRQELPDRPSEGSQSYDITCATCGANLQVVIASPDVLRRRRATRIVIGIVVIVVGLILGVHGANIPNDPETFEYPLRATVLPFVGLGIVIVGLCFLAFGRQEKGARIDPRASRARNLHWIVR